MDTEYVKVLETENEMLHRKMEMTQTLSEILSRYFCLTKETNRNGEVSYGLVLSSAANSGLLRQEDYDYLKSVGVHEDEIKDVDDFQKNVTVTNDDKMVNEILDHYYKSIKIPASYFNGLSEPCPVKDMNEYMKQARDLLEKGLLDTPIV